MSDHLETSEQTKMLLKALEDVTIQDNFLFGTLLKDPEICREILQRILGVPIGSIRYPEAEKTIDTGYYSRGIRLDIYTDLPDHSVCCVEMQVRQIRNSQISVLPRRTRYYHSAIDTSILEKGEDYPDLPNSLLIFICVFDEFRQGLHRYTFRNACEEMDGLLLEDGAVTMILNTRGTAEDISPELRRFLDFVNGAPATEDDPFLCHLEERIHQIKNDQKWRHNYMIMSADYMDIRREGIQIGEARGETRGKQSEQNRIARKMLSHGDDESYVMEMTGLTQEQIDVLLGRKQETA